MCKTEHFVIWNVSIVSVHFSSPEAMVEFSGEKKLKLGLNGRQKRRCKIFIEIRSRYFFIRRRQNSPITSHAKLALCKECNQILLFSYMESPTSFPGR